MNEPANTLLWIASGVIPAFIMWRQMINTGPDNNLFDYAFLPFSLGLGVIAGPWMGVLCVILYLSYRKESKEVRDYWDKRERERS